MEERVDENMDEEEASDDVYANKNDGDEDCTLTVENNGLTPLTEPKRSTIRRE